MREPTVVASSPKAFVDFAVARGADRAELLQRAGIEPRELADPNGRVSLARYAALMDAGAELCGEPALALLYGEHVPMEALSAVALIAMNADNSDDGRNRINRYAPLLVDDGDDDRTERLVMSPRGSKIQLTLGSALYARYPRLTESAMARCVCDARRLFGAHVDAASTMRFPDEIHFTHEEPPYRSEYDRVFGVPLVFSSDVTAIVMDPALLSLPIPKPHSAAAAVVMAQADAQLMQLRASQSVRSAVERALLQGFATRNIRVDDVAGHLGMSRATLLRRLKAEHTTFEQVLAGVRHVRALHLLDVEHRSIQQTAYLLGFSDPAAFSRAFKRWTGSSPSRRHA